MLFNSLIFIFAFLPVSVYGYFFLNKKKYNIAAKAWLCALSLVFYSYWNPKYSYILFMSVIFNYTVSKMIKMPNSSSKNKKLMLIIGVSANVLALCYYKYMDFLIKNVNCLFKTDIQLLHIALPLAISFFTFQQIAYLVDSYKGKTDDDTFIDYALFVTFFPQLIAGPIVHHAELMPQFAVSKNRYVNYKNLSVGICIFCIGLFKKVVLADTFSEYVKYGFENSVSLSMIEAWLVSLSYTFQIYFDFSGYSDMAIGIGKMFNFSLPLNFNSPYKAISIQDFWRRWHMTLSRFFRDYVYIPLGGSYCGKLKTYRNLWITFLLTGIWHGASWTFVVWGTIHGLALTIHRVSKNIKIYFGDKLLTLNNRCSILITFCFVNIAWVIFRANTKEQAVKVLKAMFDYTNCILPRLHGLDVVFKTEGGGYI